MTAVKVDLLRIVLSPSHADKSVPVQCGWRLPDGSWHSGQSENLVEIAARFQIKRLEVCPHPVDVSMIEADLPPLPARKLRSAVHGAVELLALASPVNLAIGFGPRNGDGKVPIAWMADAQVAERLEELASHGLRADAVLPPPAFLPAPDISDQDDVASAVIIDDWVVVRSGANSGGLCPIPACSSDVAKLEARVQTFIPEATQIQWHRAEMAAGIGGDKSTMWSGTGWSWELPLAESSSQRREASWQRPAMAWGAGVVLVWLLGLNLYAHRVEDEGQALKREMAAQVKTAFPELSVVLNPLQQARQLRDARNAGDGSVASDDFATMVRSATSLLAQANGQVERLEYHDGQLRLGWREGAMLKASELEALQTTASERGLAIDADDGGLRLHVVAVEESGSAPATPVEPSS
ncbi:type II secretion system protein GspL [Alcaligenes nematophilus]|uniref:type II secretion system protein GspL n=1 Tax=Alcaligenes nematophilus TaxID=2994643 RepID=UPI0034E0DC64